MKKARRRNVYSALSNKSGDRMMHITVSGYSEEVSGADDLWGGDGTKYFCAF